jgi:hypothetical protein
LKTNDVPYSEASLDGAESAFSFAAAIPAEARGLLRSVRQTLPVADAPVAVKIALWIVAPVLAGFAGWMAEHIRAHNALPLGVMREGRFLRRLMRSFGIEAREFALNRHFGLLAAYGAGDDEAMVNWLARARTTPLTHASLHKTFPLYAPLEASGNIDLPAAQTLVASWRDMGEASPVRAVAQRAARDVLRHWQNTIGGEKPSAVALLDFACAGNIQRSLQTLLRQNGDETPLLGLNFLTTQGVCWAKEKGCAIHGFLAEDGKPEWISSAYARTPELAEIFVAAAPLGPLAGYDGEGAPQWNPPLLDAERQKQVAVWQEHILSAAHQYWQAMGSRLSPELCRGLWGRLLLNPLPEEALALADWPLDAGLDLEALRQLAPALAGEPESWTKMATAWPAASLLRRRMEGYTSGLMS